MAVDSVAASAGVVDLAAAASVALAEEVQAAAVQAEAGRTLLISRFSLFVSQLAANPRTLELSNSLPQPVHAAHEFLVFGYAPGGEENQDGRQEYKYGSQAHRTICKIIRADEQVNKGKH